MRVPTARGSGRSAVPTRTRRMESPSEGGMVLLEAALVIPVLVAVAAALAWALSLAGLSLSLADAARQVARDLARGVDADQAVGRAHDLVPEATIEVRVVGDVVQVVARRVVEAPVPILRDLTVPLEQSVLVPREWS